MPASSNVSRCTWPSKPLDIAYHDEEWGIPVHNDTVLFEFLTLEGAQAGLSWSTVLARREGYRKAFADWDIPAIARFTPKRVEKLMLDPGIIRHRQKIDSTIGNARAFLGVQREFGSFDRFVWDFVGGAPIINRRTALSGIPAKTPESDALSKALMKRGFRFVGSTICYAYMQAMGLVDDHLVTCFRHTANRS
jgi:DNA-3-methyladenine glycosylase I